VRTLYLDCVSGISGDMTVGALCDLGVEPGHIESELAKLALGDCHVHFAQESRAGISGIKFHVHAHGAHEHGHSHGEAHTRHGRDHAQIRELIAVSDLSSFVKERALAIFQRIAVAEAKIHGVPVETVHFHEVGAVDSIADIVGACIALEALGQPRVLVSPLREGRGWIDCAHGRFPLPAPATLEILRGITIEQIDEDWESITPTGAAIAVEFAESFGLMPPMKIERIGYGIGTRELKQRPNVLRAVLGEAQMSAPNEYQTDNVIELETNLDDLSPEMIGAAMERLLALGALDVTLTPIQMKKNRPGVTLAVLCDPALEALMVDTILTETSAFGVRRTEKRRYKLERRLEQVQTQFGEVTVKIGSRAGKIIQIAPEFESCRLVAEASGQPLRSIYQAALASASSITLSSAKSA
jgi:uncharacterized protein (TIGR00299 family) protein